MKQRGGTEFPELDGSSYWPINTARRVVQVRADGLPALYPEPIAMSSRARSHNGIAVLSVCGLAVVMQIVSSNSVERSI